jgi:hypothetical protein
LDRDAIIAALRLLAVGAAFVLVLRFAWRSLRPDLIRAGAHGLAFALGAAACLAWVTGFMWALWTLPAGWIALVFVIGVMGAAVLPRVLLMVTGGAQRLSPGFEVALGELRTGLSRRSPEAIDLALGRLEAYRSHETVALLGAWRRLADQQLASMDPERGNSSKAGLAGLVTAALLAGAVSPAVAMQVLPHDACSEVSRLLGPTAEFAARDYHFDGLTLSQRVLDDPGVGPEAFAEGYQDLEAAAASRHDPDSLKQLGIHGFRGAYHREFRTDDGFVISSAVYEFSSVANAVDFQAYANRYACVFSNEAFAGPAPGDGVGLQIRYGQGSPIVEQVSWVRGPRRYIIALDFPARPADHSTIRRLAEGAIRRSESHEAPRPTLSPPP